MRRTIAIGSLVVIVCVLLAACATPTPQVIEKEKVVTVEKVVTQVVEKQVVVTQVVEKEVIVEKPTPAPVEEAFRLRTPGKLTIAVNPAAGVLEMTEGKPSGGMLAPIATELAARLGLEPAYQPLDFPALIPALQSGRVDVVIAGQSLTQPRAQVLYFGLPYLFGPETIAVRPGERITSFEEAAAKKLTLATGVGFWYIGEWEKMGINVHTFDSNDACYLDVINGGADGCMVGTFVILYRKATEPDSAIAKLDVYEMSGPLITADLNSFTVSKDNPALSRALSNALRDMFREGKVAEAVKSVMPDWELFQVPPRGQGVYVPGPWEEGVVPPASEVYPTVTTVSANELTVGVVGNSPMLQLEGSSLVGPEAEILAFAAGKVGLTVKGIAVTDGAAAVREGKVDLIAGALAATEEESHKYWQSTPVGFNPDYIYVKPGEGGGYPAFASWDDVKAAGGKLAVISGNPRIQDIKTAGVEVVEVPDVAAGMKALVDGSALGFVGSSVDFVVGVSQDPTAADAGIGWVRNNNIYTYGEAYVWGVKAGNTVLIDALNQAITAAWQQNVIASAYKVAFPGANVTALLAPGPTAIGTSYAAAKDFLWRAMWMPGPWLQGKDWVQ